MSSVLICAVGGSPVQGALCADGGCSDEIGTRCHRKLGEHGMRTCDHQFMMSTYISSEEYVDVLDKNRGAFLQALQHLREKNQTNAQEALILKTAKEAATSKMQADKSFSLLIEIMQLHNAKIITLPLDYLMKINRMIQS